MKRPDFEKFTDGLIPAIVQDANSAAVLMLGYMNEEALNQTQATGNVVFYSRSKQRLWMKGETSGNLLRMISITADCDQDCLLVQVVPSGPVCHTGTDTCFGNLPSESLSFLQKLEEIIGQRKTVWDDTSYVSRLFEKGINKIAQKVGEEAVELVIESKDQNDELFRNEAADLLFHYLILLQAKGCSLADIVDVLRARHGGVQVATKA